MSTASPSSRFLITAGYIAMLVGAIDPMEGSLLVLPGSGLVALGTFLGPRAKRLLTYRLWAFLLVAAGVGGLWSLSIAGGFGGTSGLSNWWGLLILPYLIGWSIGIWGPGVPRWLPALGLVVGIWYLAIAGMIFRNASLPEEAAGAASVFGAMGLLTIGGCLYRLRTIVKG